MPGHQARQVLCQRRGRKWLHQPSKEMTELKLKGLNLTGAALLFGLLMPVSAQMPVAPAELGYAPVPFGPGERMTYEVKLGFVGKVGKGSMEVTSIDTVHGFPT